jgi:protein phosphatase
MEMHVWCQTDVGLKRETNQDSFLFDEEIGLFMVADGMGGHRGGEVASRMAVDVVRDFIRKAVSDSKRRFSPHQLLRHAYLEASRSIYDHSQNSDLAGMGTTLVTAFFHGGILYIGNVGDSRAYLFRPGPPDNGLLWQLTEDHSLINEQLRSGVITEFDLSRAAPKNVITRSVGFEREVQVDVIEREMQSDEMILMCSDGLSGLVSDRRIAEICSLHTPAEIVSVCVEEAKNNGGDDNVTVMVLNAGPHPN